MTTHPTDQQPVLVIMGVSGSGKSTVAGILAGQLGWDLEEGDDLHPPANVAKMSAGTPLTDQDRWPWLDKVAEWITEHTAAGLPGIITCSALKRIYRDRMRGDHVIFVHLTGDRDTINQRISARQDHFMVTQGATGRAWRLGSRRCGHLHRVTPTMSSACRRRGRSRPADDLEDPE